MNLAAVKETPVGPPPPEEEMTNWQAEVKTLYLYPKTFKKVFVLNGAENWLKVLKAYENIIHMTEMESPA